MSTGLCPTCLVGMEPARSRDGGLLWRCEDCGHEAVRRVEARGRGRAMATTRCTVCNGAAVSGDRDGVPIYVCIDKGHVMPRDEEPKPMAALPEVRERPVMETNRPTTNGVSATPVAPVAPVAASAQTWDQVARSRLNVLLKEIGGVDPKKVEAEEIYRALAAAGRADLPVLSWMTPTTRKQGAGQRGPVEGLRKSDVPVGDRDAYRTDACQLCGYRFGHGVEMAVTRQGSVCRSERLCAARKAKASAA